VVRGTDAIRRVLKLTHALTHVMDLADLVVVDVRQDGKVTMHRIWRSERLWRSMRRTAPAVQ